MDIDQKDSSEHSPETALEHRRKAAHSNVEEQAQAALVAWIKKDLLCTGIAMPGLPKRYAYIRVSTIDQNVDRQLQALEAVSDELFIEYVSAVAKDRPVFTALLEVLKPGDSIVILDLDRAFRSAKDAILTVELLKERGVGLHVISSNVDLDTAEGEFFYTIMAGAAQYERRMMSRRTREGLEAARRKGKTLGRPRAITPETTRQAYDWISDSGYPCGYVAALLGISRITLQRAFKRHGLKI